MANKQTVQVRQTRQIRKAGQTERSQSHYSQERLKQLRARMRALKLDALITLDPANLRWMSAWQEVFDEEPAHLALITLNKAYLHTDSRYIAALEAKNAQGIWHIDSKPVSHFAFVQQTLARSRKEGLRLGYESSIRLDLFKALKKALTSTRVKLVDTKARTAQTASTKALASTAVKLVETKGVFEALRSVKDDEEVRLLCKAQAITDAAFKELLIWIKPGMRELEIANRLDFALRERGAEGVAFQSIVASGPHSALPHARPTSRALRSGDFLVLDFGARYRDYCADMTRTLVIGEATAKQRALYGAVLAAQEKAKAGIHVGITGKEVDELAREVLRIEELDQAFTHSLGHGVGIAVHEQPNLSPHNKQPLVAGNVVTVEPGVYLPGYGGVRIEDFGVVEQAGFKCFTQSTHELIEIKER